MREDQIFLGKSTAVHEKTRLTGKSGRLLMIKEVGLGEDLILGKWRSEKGYRQIFESLMEECFLEVTENKWNC